MGQAKRKKDGLARLKIEPIQEILDKVCKPDFDACHVAHLLISLRPVFNAIDPILLDLSNFIAHPEGRDAGVSFKCVSRFVETIIAASKRGGPVSSPPPVFVRRDITSRLLRALKEMKLNFDESAFIARSELIIDNILHLIAEKELVFTQPEVVKCYLKRENAEVMLCLHLDIQGPSVKILPSTSLRFKLFA